jgi:hypothetical protein
VIKKVIKSFIQPAPVWESSKQKFGRKYIIWENLNLKQRYRVYYKISIQPNAHSHIDPRALGQIQFDNNSILSK